jgi:hypothetical protein
MANTKWPKYYNIVDLLIYLNGLLFYNIVLSFSLTNEKSRHAKVKVLIYSKVNVTAEPIQCKRCSVIKNERKSEHTFFKWVNTFPNKPLVSGLR